MDDTFDPLGILCQIIAPRHWLPCKPGERSWFRYGGHERAGFLPEPFAEEVGLPESEQDVICDLFDSGKSFAAIAAWIEEHL